MDFVSIAWWRSIFLRFGQGCAFIMLITLVIGFGWNQFGNRNGAQGGDGSVAAQQAVIMTVNGDPITQAQFQSVAAQSGGTAGTDFANKQGQALNSLVQAKIIEQLAKERNVHPLDVDIDRALAAERAQAVPKGASDADWEAYVEQRHNMSLAEYRDALSKQPQAFVAALSEDFKSKETVSDQDIQNQNVQARLNVVFIPTVSGQASPTPPGGKKPVPDAIGQKTAEDLLAKAKAGGDIAAIAKASSGDFTASKGGDTGFRPEYKAGQQSPFGAFNYGKAFDDAVHKTETGKFTDVVAASGFQHGYVFAKVAERKTDVPKDFNPKKAGEDLKAERAQQKLGDLFKAKYKAAQVVVKDPDKKAYYDNAKLQEMQQQMMMASVQGDAKDVPTKADVDKQQALVESEWEALLTKHPDDATAAAIVAANLEAKGPTQAGVSDRLITLYNTILKSSEDQTMRFKLAGLYQQKKQNDLAFEQYQKIAKLMSYNPPFDAATMRTTQSTHQQLAQGYRAIGKTDEAKKEEAAAAALTPKITEATAQEAAAQKAAQQQAAPPPTLLPPGGKASGGTLTLPAPNAKTAPPASTTPPVKK